LPIAGGQRRQPGVRQTERSKHPQVADLGGQDVEPVLIQAGFAPAGESDVARAIEACGGLRSWIAATEATCIGEVRRRKGDASQTLAGQGASRRRAAAAVRRSKTVESLPDVGGSLSAGTITPDHLDAFGSVRRDHAEALAADSAALLEPASNVDADQFRQGLRRWQQEQDRRGGESELERQRNNRKGSASTRADDGMGVFRFVLDAIVAAKVSAALAQKSERLWRSDHTSDVVKRSPAQRMADAFEELVCSGGSDGVVDTTIMIVADVDTLRAGLPGRCELLDGTPLPVDEVRELALDARLLPAIFDCTGQPLWLGRSARLPNAAQRAAIAARDRGCSVPGCDAPVGWCQIHHIIWWSHGGATDLDNLITVCSKHHHLVHENGWQIGRNADGTVTWRGPP